MGLTQGCLSCFILPSIIEAIMQDESLNFVFHVSSTEICATLPFVVLIFLSGFGIDPLSLRCQMLNTNFFFKFCFSNWAEISQAGLRVWFSISPYYFLHKRDLVKVNQGIKLYFHCTIYGYIISLVPGWAESQKYWKWYINVPNLHNFTEYVSS